MPNGHWSPMRCGVSTPRPECFRQTVSLPGSEGSISGPGSGIGDTKMFDVIREFAHGLKLGARHAVSTRHNLTEKAMRPSLRAALEDRVVGSEQAGR